MMHDSSTTPVSPLVTNLHLPTDQNFLTSQSPVAPVSTVVNKETTSSSSGTESKLQDTVTEPEDLEPGDYQELNWSTEKQSNTFGLTTAAEVMASLESSTIKFVSGDEDDDDDEDLDPSLFVTHRMKKMEDDRESVSEILEMPLPQSGKNTRFSSVDQGMEEYEASEDFTTEGKAGGQFEMEQRRSNSKPIEDASLFATNRMKKIQEEDNLGTTESIGAIVLGSGQKTKDIYDFVDPAGFEMAEYEDDDDLTIVESDAEGQTSKQSTAGGLRATGDQNEMESRKATTEKSSMSPLFVTNTMKKINTKMNRETAGTTGKVTSGSERNTKAPNDFQEPDVSEFEEYEAEDLTTARNFEDGQNGQSTSKSLGGAKNKRVYQARKATAKSGAGDGTKTKKGHVTVTTTRTRLEPTERAPSPSFSKTMASTTVNHFIRQVQRSFEEEKLAKASKGPADNLAEYLEAHKLSLESNPVLILACSYEMLPRRKCSSLTLFKHFKHNVKTVMDAPQYNHDWYHDFKTSANADQMFKEPDSSVDKILVQSLFLSVANHVNRMAQAGTMTRDDFVFIKRFMRQKKNQFRKRIGTQITGNKFDLNMEHFALEMTLNISRRLIDQLRISPQDLLITKSLKHPIILDLFGGFIESGKEKNPVLHEILCSNSLLHTSCQVSNLKGDPMPTGVSNLYENVMAVLDDKEKSSRWNKTIIELIETVKEETKKELADSVLSSLQMNQTAKHGGGGGVSEVASMSILHQNLNKTQINHVKSNLTDHKFKIAQAIIEHLRIKPEDLGLGKNASKDESLRKAFRWYYEHMSAKQRQVLLQVDALFKESRAIIAGMSLTADKTRRIKALQRKVNRDSSTVAERYLNINATGREHQVSKILSEMMKNGSLSDIVIDEVNEFALLQKVYIIMKLNNIMGFDKSTYTQDLIEAIPPAYISIMFDEKRETQGKLTYTTPGTTQKGDGKSKRDAESRNTSAVLGVNSMLNIAFFLYQRAISIVAFRKRQGSLGKDILEELNDILDSQQSVLMKRLHAHIGNESITNAASDSDKLGVVLLQGEVSESQSDFVNREILKLQLKTTKQIIIMLDLTPTDFNVHGALTSGIMHYLFGTTPDIRGGDANAYLVSVNNIYFKVRSILSQMAYGGVLSAKQTIAAKKVIFQLNKQSVEAMVEVLSLDSTMIQPEQLIDLIKSMIADEDLDEKTRSKIKRIIYENKLKAIRQLILLLDLTREEFEDIDSIPEDLVEFIFTAATDSFSNGTDPDDNNSTQEEFRFDSLSGDISGVFCMSCFHRLYTNWKREHNIHDEDLEEAGWGQTEDRPRARMDAAGKTLIEKSIEDIGMEVELPIVHNPAARGRSFNRPDGFVEDAEVEQKVFQRSYVEEEQSSRHVGIVLHLYYECVKLGKRMRLRKDKEVEFQELLSSQEQMILTNLPSLLGNSTFSSLTNPLGMVLETANLSDEKQLALERFVFQFHLSMVKKLVHLLGLSRSDFDNSINIPGSIADVIFDPLLLDIGEREEQTLDIVFNFTQTELARRRLYKSMPAEYIDNAQRSLEDLEVRYRQKINLLLGSPIDASVTLRQLLKIIDDRVTGGSMTPTQSETLRRELFFDKLRVTRSLVRSLDLEVHEIPNFIELDHEVLDLLFNSMSSGDDEAFLDQLERNNNDENGDDYLLLADDGFTAHDLILERTGEHEDPEKISMRTLNNYNTNNNLVGPPSVPTLDSDFDFEVISPVFKDRQSGEDDAEQQRVQELDPLDYVIETRSLRREDENGEENHLNYIMRRSAASTRRSWTCKELRSSLGGLGVGASKLVLSPRQLQEFDPREILSCLDVISLSQISQESLSELLSVRKEEDKDTQLGRWSSIEPLLFFEQTGMFTSLAKAGRFLTRNSLSPVTQPCHWPLGETSPHFMADENLLRYPCFVCNYKLTRQQVQNWDFYVAAKILSGWNLAARCGEDQRTLRHNLGVIADLIDVGSAFPLIEEEMYDFGVLVVGFEPWRLEAALRNKLGERKMVLQKEVLHLMTEEQLGILVENTIGPRS